MANWKEPKNDYKKEDQVVPEIFNTLAENERYLQEKKITTEQVQDATVNSTQATSRVTIGGSETVKGFFGKVRKWLADLKALAFKKTVATADIDDSAVTDAKIKEVSASKVTGLHKVATSGDYNDLINKPSSGGGGGFNFKRYDFYLSEQPNDIDAGIYLCFVIFTNRASITNVANLGLITCSPGCDNGSYSGISTIYDSGEEFKIQLCMHDNGKVGLLSSRTESECPTQSGYDGDGSFRVTLIKLSDLGTVGLEDEEGGAKSWKLIDVWGTVGHLDDYANSIDIPVSGLKVGDKIKVTLGEIKVNMSYMSDSYFYNTSNICYGWVYQGMSGYDMWYQLQWENEFAGGSEKEVSSDSSWSTNVGLLDYSTDNRMTIKVSCKRAGYLTIEWTDQAMCYIQSVTLDELQVYR